MGVAPGKGPIGPLPDGGSGRFRDALFKKLENLSVFRESTFLLLGKDQRPVEREFELAPIGGDQRPRGDLLLVFSKHGIRQTDGLRLVVSKRAVNEFQLHDTGSFGSAGRSGIASLDEIKDIAIGVRFEAKTGPNPVDIENWAVES
jgi:hypothetical protein